MAACSLRCHGCCGSNRPCGTRACCTRVGNAVAVSWTGAAVTGTGAPVNWSGINIYELDDNGLIREARAYFNRAIFQAQLDR